MNSTAVRKLSPDVDLAVLEAECARAHRSALEHWGRLLDDPPANLARGVISRAALRLLRHQVQKLLAV